MDYINITQINIRTWEKNKYLLTTALHSSLPDIFLLNENNTSKNIKCRGYYTIQNFNNHSGVAILIKNNIQFSIIPTSNDTILAIKIQTTLGPLIIATIYSPPRFNHINTITLNKLLDQNTPFIIIGDFNAKHNIFHNFKSNKEANAKIKGEQLFQLIKNRNMHILGPDFDTFETNRGKGKPDLIISNHSFNIFHSQISRGPFVGSDHRPIIMKISTSPIKIARIQLNTQSLSIQNFKANLQEDEFEPLQNKNVEFLNTQLSTLIENIKVATENNCQKITIKEHKSYTLTKQVKQKIKQIQTAYNSYLINGYPKYNIIRLYIWELNILILDKNSESWKKIVEVASDCYGNPHKFWNKISKLLGNKSKNNTFLQTTIYNTTSDSEDSDYDTESTIIATDPQEKAELMAKTWKSIYRPNTGPEFNNENIKKVEEWYKNNVKNWLHQNIIDYEQLDPNHPILSPITTKEIIFTVKKLKSHKAPGPSGIKAFIVKQLPPNYYEQVKHIYNAVIVTKYWPILFKTAHMIFLSKPSTDKTNPSNYRPISLLEILAKILESIITKRLLFYLEYNNILPSSQFGFRKNKATTHSLYLLKETITEIRKQKKAAIITTRDIRKAFDTVWHAGLLYKIKHIAKLDDQFTSFIYNYLSNRIIIPTFDNAKGTAFSPLAGVPQGSSIGPILFLTFVSDIPKPVHDNTIILQYADDLIHVMHSDSKGKNKIKHAIQKTQNELTHTLEWEEKWRIKTNLNKCNINFTGTSIGNIEYHQGVNIRDTELSIKNPCIILGYNLTNHLSESSHTIYIQNKAKNNLHRLYRFNHAPPKIKKQLYLTLIRPLIEYPCTTIINSSKCEIQKLQRIQNEALRFIVEVRLRDRIPSEVLHNLTNIAPFNIRLHNLAHKTLYKIKETQSENFTIDETVGVSGLDNITNKAPIYEKTTPLVITIKNEIFDPKRKLYIENLPEDPDDLTIPAPKYT